MNKYPHKLQKQLVGTHILLCSYSSSSLNEVNYSFDRITYSIIGEHY